MKAHKVKTIVLLQEKIKLAHQLHNNSKDLSSSSLAQGNPTL